MSATVDWRGKRMMLAAQFIPENKFASPRAKELSFVSGMVAQDIDIISEFAVKGEYLIVFRCPDSNANFHVAKVKEGKAEPKPHAAPKGMKTGEHGSVKHGDREYVSDYDLMCVYKRKKDASDGESKFEKKAMNWNGSSPMSHAEQEVIGALNTRLHYKIQHGCNDDWLDEGGEPKNADIGEDFIMFLGNRVEILSKRELKAVYEDLKLKWHAKYGLTGNSAQA